MKLKSVIAILIVCSAIPSIVQGFFLRRPEYEDSQHNRFDIFIQELVKFKIRLIKNIIYPLLVEVPWKRLFEPEKYFHEEMQKRNRSSDAPVASDDPHRENKTQEVPPSVEPVSLIRNDFPTNEMIRLAMPDDDVLFQDSEEFDEVELLRAIPDIVEQMRLGRVTHEEKILMQSVYGELWPLIEQEARRDRWREMNPILRAIFNSRELQMTTTAGTRKARATNDVHWNTLNTINHKPKTNLRAKRHNPGAPPSVRLMDTVAILVRESLRGNLKSPKKELERKKRLAKKRLEKKRQEKKRLEKERVEAAYRKASTIIYKMPPRDVLTPPQKGHFNSNFIVHKMQNQ
ncbi:uncharacterized protein LOC129794655 [Lutzomyia longipalpis]|uniref:uncharacterized protein LOC129794655 n=1 Tax=Lutzomyia longipalpis TaxID=7200 RepID=UPI002483EB72|nr:uncharacterized protein LOC129794655 [Lutzomyia longipalpis]